MSKEDLGVKAIQREGWLKKEGQKRYFILTNTVLTWLEQPLGKPKGTIDLRNYGISLEPPKKGPTASETLRGLASGLGKKIASNKNPDEGEVPFVIVPLQHGSKEYTLWAPNETARKEWVLSMKMAKNSKTTPTFSANGRGAWLEKKGKRRWFVLKNNILYWFKKEQSQNSDFLAAMDIQGQFSLANCAVQIAFNSNTFNIYNPVGQLAYVISCKDDFECKEWVSDIESSINRQKELSNQASFLSTLNVLMSAWIIKRKKKRFLTLERERLVWYVTEKDYQEKRPKNSIGLSGCDVFNNSHMTQKTTFLVCTALGQQYEMELIDATKDQAEKWTEAIKKSIDQATKPKSSHTSDPLEKKTKDEIREEGWLIKDGKKRYVVLMEDAILCYSEKPGEELKGIQAINRIKDNITDVKSLFRQAAAPLETIPLAACTVFPIGQTTLCVRSSRERHDLTARTESEAQTWANAIRFSIVESNLALSKSDFNASFSKQKSGWLQKRGQARWFLVVNDVLMWFTSEQTGQLSRHAKGSVALSGCTVAKTATLQNTFTLATEKNISYILTAGSSEQCDDWVFFLKDAISKANWAQNQQLNQNIKAGILFKKGRKRYFILRNNTLMWYTPEEQEKIGSGKLKSSIGLAGCTVKENREIPESLSLKSNSFEYILKAGSSQEIREWIDAIQNSIKTANSASAHSYTLAEQNAKQLHGILLQKDFSIPVALCTVYQSDDMIQNIVGYCYSQGKHLDFLSLVVINELRHTNENSNSAASSVLFRGDSVATKAVRAYFKMTLLDYTKKMLTPYIINVTDNTDKIEIDPEKCKNDPSVNLEESIVTIQKYAKAMIDALILSVDRFPNEVRGFLSDLRKIVEERAPKGLNNVLVNFVFLRFFCPAILAPEGFGLLDAPPQPHQRRIFVLIVKCIQCVVNGQSHLDKEPFMKPLKPFIEEQTVRTHDYLLRLTVVPEHSSIGEIRQAKPTDKESTFFLASFLNYLENNWGSVLNELDPNMAEIPQLTALLKTK